MRTRQSRVVLLRSAVLIGAFGVAGCFSEVKHLDASDHPRDSSTPDLGLVAEVRAGVDVSVTSTGGSGEADGAGGAVSIDGADVPIGGGGAGGSASIFGSGGSTSVGGSSGSGGSIIDAPIDQKLAAPVGSACSVDKDCTLGNCIDGVCCATTCTGCNACASTWTGKSDGTCAPALGGKNPHGACVDETATNQCGNDGTCDGAGACRKVSTSHVCGQSACNGSIFTPKATCDGQGACKQPATQNCDPFQCASTGCLQTCSLPTDCGSASYCKITSGTSGTCTAKNPPGTPATQPTECTSNVVADGVCCNQACTGCNACSGSPLTAGSAGQCLPVVAGQVAHSACAASGTTCGLDGKCDGAGACRYSPAEGASCNDSNLCITGRTCQSHACSTGTTKTCPAPTQKCRNPGVCDPATANCNYAVAATNTPCDDGNSCTDTDLCTASGTCAGTPKACNSPTPCYLSPGTCSGGTCSYATPASNGSVDYTCPGGTQFCNGGQCVQCTADIQCSSMRPSCDTSSHRCVCKKPSPENLLKNGGFDGSLANWTQAFVTRYDPLDSDGCAESGSVYSDGSGENDPVQCFPVTAGKTYYVGLRSRAGIAGGQIRFHFWGGINCTGSIINTAVPIDFGTPSDNTTWVSYDGYSFTPPAGTVSADLSIYAWNQWLDQIYVNPTTQRF